MKLEHKFIPLISLKVSDEAPGTIEGYRSVFGVIDEGGDITLKGAFSDTHDSYLSSGFTAQSHDWDFKESIGYPIEAKEDESGWFVVSKFHSTEDAQKIRTKAKERLADGKAVGFSFGYMVNDYSYIEAKDYPKQLPLYVKADRLGEMMTKAQGFSRIRLLKKVQVFEDSIVTAPMNQSALATAVKSITPEFQAFKSSAEKQGIKFSGQTIDTKAMFEDELQERLTSMWALTDILECILYRIYWSAQEAARLGYTFDYESTVRAAMEEFLTRYLAAIAEEVTEEMPASVAYAGISQGSKSVLASGQTLEQRFSVVASAMEESARRSALITQTVEQLVVDGKAKAKFRAETKEGRTLSQSTLNKLTNARDAMTSASETMSQACGHIDELMTASEPKSRARKLRLESLRMQAASLAA